MKAILVGYSGHGLVVEESAIIMGVEFYGYTDLYEIDKNPFDLRYFGNEQSKDYNWNLTDKYVLGIGSNKLRSKAFKFLKSKSIDNFIIEIGGEINASGITFDKKKPWIVAIDMPRFDG